MAPLFLCVINKCDCGLESHLNVRISVHLSMKQRWGFSHLHNKLPKLSELIDS